MLTRGPRINKLPQNSVLELFDLSTDPEEKQNIASQNMYVCIYFLRTNRAEVAAHVFRFQCLIYRSMVKFLQKFALSEYSFLSLPKTRKATLESVSCIFNTFDNTY